MANMPRSVTKALRPRSRLLLLLGDQLIRDANMAVFEMVKNAYDADATFCNVTLRNVDSHREGVGQIEVRDDGTGMTIDTVLDQWLEPGTDYRGKQRERGERTKSGRLPLGEKGVGRFAVHKLGRLITLVTRAKNAAEVVVDIDWNDFASDTNTEDDVKYLDDVPITVREREPEVFTGKATGTQIIVRGLREVPWTRRSVRSLHRAITAISSPIDDDTSFEARLVVTPEKDWLDGLMTHGEVFKHALFEFSAKLHGRHLEYQYEFRPDSTLMRKGVRPRKVGKIIDFPLLRQPEPIELSSTTTVDLPEGVPDTSVNKGVIVDLDKVGLKPFALKLYIFDLDRKVLSSAGGNIRAFRDYLDANGGVRVYRDGIRVYDFGEPGNDWLDLEGRRVNTPSGKIGNNQVIGMVFLDLEGSSALIEKTNREGFVENDAYRALRDAVSCAVLQAAAERNQDKERLRKVLHGSTEHVPVLDELQEIRSQLRERKLESNFDAILRRIEFEHRKFRDTMLLAAGTGLNLAAVIHQVEKDIRLLSQLLKRNRPKAEIEDTVVRLGQLTDTMAWLLSESPQGRVTASELIDQAIRTWRFRFEHHQIKVINGFEKDKPCPDFEQTMSRKLVATALMNLIDNAIYWTSTRPDGRQIYIGTSLDVGDGPAIVVADNGSGFQGDEPSALVQPFFTRKPGGTGLGLHISNEIMKQHGGTLVFPEKGDVPLPRGLDGACVALCWGDSNGRASIK